MSARGHGRTRRHRGSTDMRGPPALNAGARPQAATDMAAMFVVILCLFVVISHIFVAIKHFSDIFHLLVVMLCFFVAVLDLHVVIFHLFVVTLCVFVVVLRVFVVIEHLFIVISLVVSNIHVVI